MPAAVTARVEHGRSARNQVAVPVAFALASLVSARADAAPAGGGEHQRHHHATTGDGEAQKGFKHGRVLRQRWWGWAT